MNHLSVVTPIATASEERTIFLLGAEVPSLRHFLGHHGWGVSGFTDVPSLVSAVRREAPDVVVVDLDGSAVRGPVVSELLRSLGFEGGILLTRRGASELDIVASLDAGADDYLAKPLPGAELAARLDAVVRRTRRAEAGPAASDDIRIDESARRAWSGGTEVELSMKEFDVLVMLTQGRGSTVSRARLLEIWPGTVDRETNRSLDRIVARLRHKLALAGSGPRLVSVRGRGFRLDDIPLAAGS